MIQVPALNTIGTQLGCHALKKLWKFYSVQPKIILTF